MPQSPQQTITEDIFPEENGGIVKLTTNLYLVLNVRMHKALPLLRCAVESRVPSAQGIVKPLLAKA
jgi:hypothetical protein